MRRKAVGSMEYRYAPELPKPGALKNVDFANPALAPVIRMLAGNMRRAARGWTAPDGLRFRVFGTEPECFVVEPDTGEKLPGMVFCHGGGFFLPLQTSALELAARASVVAQEYKEGRLRLLYLLAQHKSLLGRRIKSKINSFFHFVPLLSGYCPLSYHSTLCRSGQVPRLS